MSKDGIDEELYTKGCASLLSYAKMMRHYSILAPSKDLRQTYITARHQTLTDLIKLDPENSPIYRYKLTKSQAINSEPLLLLSKPLSECTSIDIVANRIFFTEPQSKITKDALLSMLEILYHEPDLRSLYDAQSIAIIEHPGRENIIFADSAAIKNLCPAPKTGILAGIYNGKKTIIVELKSDQLLDSLAIMIHELMHKSICTCIKKDLQNDSNIASATRLMLNEWFNWSTIFASRCTYEIGQSMSKYYKSAPDKEVCNEVYSKIMDIYRCYTHKKEYEEVVVRYMELVAEGISPVKLADLLGGVGSFVRENILPELKGYVALWRSANQKFSQIFAEKASESQEHLLPLIIKYCQPLICKRTIISSDILTICAVQKGFLSCMQAVISLVQRNECTDYANLLLNQMMDLAKKDQDAEMVKLIEMSRRTEPPIDTSPSFVATLSNEVSAKHTNRALT